MGTELVEYRVNFAIFKMNSPGLILQNRMHRWTLSQTHGKQKLTVPVLIAQKAYERCQEALMEAKDGVKRANYTIREYEYVMSTQHHAGTI